LVIDSGGDARVAARRGVSDVFGRVQAPGGWDGSAPSGWRTTTASGPTHAVLAGLRMGGEGRCWVGAVIGSAAEYFRRRWAGYRRFPTPRISARSSSDSPPQMPYGSRVRRACRRHSSRTGQPWQIAFAWSIRRCFWCLRSLAGWKNISTFMPRHVASNCQFILRRLVAGVRVPSERCPD
jgi:hypothetical protein